ncbi:hypothetical protein DRO30_05550, partial [Candidatus Bathyarchaeota archaeon]
MGNQRVKQPYSGLIGPKKPRESRKTTGTVELGLVAANITQDDDLLAELERLSASFGIGIV